MDKINAVIVTAHGNFADGIYSAIQLVAGDVENIKLVNFPEGSTFEDIDNGLKESYKSLSEYKNVLVLTDLKGGTPFNRAVIVLGENANIRVLSGLNFVSLYQGLFSETEDIDALAEEVIEMGREGIDKYVTLESKSLEEDDDGI